MFLSQVNNNPLEVRSIQIKMFLLLFCFPVHFLSVDIGWVLLLNLLNLFLSEFNIFE